MSTQPCLNEKNEKRQPKKYKDKWNSKGAMVIFLLWVKLKFWMNYITLYWPGIMAYPEVSYCNLKNTQTAMKIGGHITLKSCVTPGVLSQKCMTELQRKKGIAAHKNTQEKFYRAGKCRYWKCSVHEDYWDTTSVIRVCRSFGKITQPRWDSLVFSWLRFSCVERKREEKKADSTHWIQCCSCANMPTQSRALSNAQ